MRSISKIELKPLTNSMFLKELRTHTPKILHTYFMPDVMKEEFDICAIISVDLDVDIENWLKHSVHFNDLYKYEDIIFVFSCTEKEFEEYSSSHYDVDKPSYKGMCERVKTMFFDKFSLNIECFIVVKDKFDHVFNNRVKEYLKNLV